MYDFDHRRYRPRTRRRGFPFRRVTLLLALVSLWMLLVSPQSRETVISRFQPLLEGAGPASNPLVGNAAPLPTLVPTPAHTWPVAPPGVVPTIPILMYHYVRYVDAAADPLGYNLSVTPDQLAAQLDWLAAQGYATVRMDTVEGCLRGTGPCPARAVALTFDDGYADAFSAALPMLQQHGFVATFYIVGDFVGRPGYMNWDELRAMRDAGMEIGAHSVTHPDLTAIDPGTAAAEIAESGRRLAAELGVPITSFCYPSGRFNPAVVEMVRAAGYTNATTTIQSADYSDLLALPRVRVYGEMTLDGFAGSVQNLLP